MTYPLHGCRIDSRAQYARAFEGSDALRNTELGPDEAAFIQAQRSFYMATVPETGWPYVQHRGGRPGFLEVIDPKTLSFIELPGNRQFIGIGNLGKEARVAFIMVDYSNRQRLKLLGRLPVQESSADQKPKRHMTIHVEAFDWNSPQHIPQRFEAADVAAAIESRDQRIAALKSELQRLRPDSYGTSSESSQEKP